MNVSQLNAVVKAEGADIAEMQLKAVGLASNVAGLAVASMGSRMKAAGLEFFDFDAVSKEFVSNMAESAGVTDAVTPAVDAMRGALASTIPTVAELDAQFAAMRARLTEVGASADVEAAGMRRSLEAMHANAEAARANASATREVERSHTSAGHSSLNLMGTLFNLQFAYQMLVVPIGNIVKGMFDYQAIQTQTNAVLKSTKGISGETAGSIAALAESFARLTLFSRDSVQSVENILLTFPSISKNIFPQTTQAVLDLSQAMHQNLKQSAIEVGKALDDPARGLTNLRRIGVQFTDAQAAVIKQLVATGHTAEAQKLILQELNKEFGNSAKAAGQTFGGQLAILGHHLQDTGEKIGMMLMPWLTKLVDAVAPIITSFLDWWTNSDNLTGVLNTLNYYLGPLISAIQDMYAYLQPLIQQVIDWAQNNNVVSRTLSAVKVGIQFLADALRFIVPIIVQIIGAVIAFVSSLLDTMMPTITALVTFIQTNWQAIFAIISGVWNSIVGVVKIAWALVSGIIKIGLDIFQGNWKKAWTDAKDMIGGIWDGIKQALFGAVHTILGYLALIPGSIGDMANAALKWLDSLNTGAKKSTLELQQVVVKNLQATVAGIQTQLDNATSSSQRHFLKMKLDAAQASLDLQTAVLNNLQGLVDGSNKKLGKMSADALVQAKAMKKNVLDKLQELNDSAIGHSIIPDMITAIGKAFTDMAKAALTWGSTLINNFLAGLQAAWAGLIAWVNTALANLAAMFPASPVKAGPLKGSEKWGYNFIKNIADGMRSGMPLINAALAGLGAGTMGSMNISHSFSGGLSSPPAFMGSGQTIIVKVYPVVQPNDIYIDKHKLTDIMGESITSSIIAQTGFRRFNR